MSSDKVNKTPSGKNIITRSVLKPRPAVESTEKPKIPDRDPLAMDEEKSIHTDDDVNIEDEDDDDDDEKPLVIDEPQNEKPVKVKKVIIFIAKQHIFNFKTLRTFYCAIMKIYLSVNFKYTL